MARSSSRTAAAGAPSGGGTPQLRGNRADTLFDPATRLGRDLAAVDWPATPLGPLDTWQGSLRSVVRLMLGSRFAMWMAWGPGLTFLCNDAYRLNTLGAKYPWALGRPASEVWEEIWTDIGPLIDSVITEGAATWSEDLLLLLERSGYPEETYHTFSYSPITDDDGVIAGMLCVVSEETARVISERRMRVVRGLSSALAVAGTQAEVFAAAAAELSADGRSVPFAVGYLFDDNGDAERVLAAGVPSGHRLAPATVRADDPDPLWPVRAATAGRVELVDDLAARFGPALPTGDWGEAPKQAMVVPFVEPGAGRAFGLLVVGLNRHRMLDADYRGFVQLVAGQVGAAITRARAYEAERRRAEELAELDRAAQEAAAREHAIATELQRSLLPARTPRSEALDIAAYYQAGVEDTQAGGDWYDVIELPRGRTAVVIGDVMGRGVRAAAVMGQLRAMTRAYTRLDLPVDTLLRQLDAEVAATAGGTIVTCVYAVIDPATGTLTYGTAGHVPPLLQHGDGTVTRLVVGDPPLGTGKYAGSIETVRWEPGARLVLYTDGLVEQRGEDLDANIDRLAALLGDARVVVEALPDTLVETMLPDRPGDDVAVLAVATRSVGSRDVAMTVAPVDTSVAEARHLVSEALAKWGVPRSVVGDVVLVVSELVTNTLRYGAAPIELRMRLDTAHGASPGGSVVVDVSDAAVARPEILPMTPDAPNGRGMHLVAALCDAWGARPMGNGKSVWCVFAL